MESLYVYAPRRKAELEAQLEKLESERRSLEEELKCLRALSVRLPESQAPDEKLQVVISGGDKSQSLKASIEQALSSGPSTNADLLRSVNQAGGRAGGTSKNTLSGYMGKLKKDGLVESPKKGVWQLKA